MKKIALIFLLAACGGGVEPEAVESQIRWGRLEVAEALLQRMDPAHERWQDLRAQIDGVWAQRKNAADACAVLRANREGRKLERVLVDLSELAKSFDDEQAREIVLREKSATLDWDADRRSRLAHSPVRPLGSGEPTWEDEERTLPARQDSLAQSILSDVLSASRAGQHARALALVEQLIGDLPPRASSLGVQLIDTRDEVLAAANQGARQLIAQGESAERLRGSVEAWRLIAGEYLRFPERALNGELSRRVETWRLAAINAGESVAAVKSQPGEESSQLQNSKGVRADSETSQPDGEVPVALLQGKQRPYALSIDELILDPSEQALLGEKARLAGELPKAVAFLEFAARGSSGPESSRYRRREMECRWLVALAWEWSLDDVEVGPVRGISQRLRTLGFAGVQQELIALGQKPEVCLGILVASLAEDAPKFRDLGLEILSQHRSGGLLTREHTNLLVAIAKEELVPDGGYSFVDDTFLDTIDYEERLIGKQLAQELRKITKRRGEDREQAYAAVVALANQYRLAELRLEETLDEFLTLHTKRLLRRKEMGRLEGLAMQRKDLEVARTNALELIFDTVEYFYPVPAARRAEYNLVQRRVDELVAQVREIWEAPSGVSLGGDFHQEVSDLAWVLQKLGDGSLPAQLPSWLFLIDGQVTLLDLRSFAPSLAVQREIRTSAWIEAYNEKLWAAGDEVCLPMEAEQVRVTNRYRRLLGRVSLAWDARLHAATRVHGEYMSRTGNFSHFEEDVPARRSPYDRMDEQGYRVGLGENIHAGSGSPEGAHYGWAHSSGHHRALLSRQCTEMATSVVGKYWTQNFGVGKDSRRGMN